LPAPPQAVTTALSGAPSQQAALLPVLLAFSADAVPNLRFNVAKAAEALLPSLADPALIATQMRPALTALTGDRDDDVRFYARRALAACAAAESGGGGAAVAAGGAAGAAPAAPAPVV
jgi:hypothetical protein